MNDKIKELAAVKAQIKKAIKKCLLQYPNTTKEEFDSIVNQAWREEKESKYDL